MKQDLNILLDYLTCTDPVMVTKWQNILASFWHKNDGQVITGISSTDTAITFTTIDKDGATTETAIAQYKEPASFPITKVEGLVDQLDNKVDKAVGKGLSSEDFTQAEKTKLANLENYNAPNSEEIAYINGLQDALNALQDNINAVADSIGQGNPVVIYFKGYRLYKELGNTLTYPEAGEELKGRGDGTLFGGEIIHVTAKTDLPDPAAVTDNDFNFINSTP